MEPLFAFLLNYTVTNSFNLPTDQFEFSLTRAGEEFFLYVICQSLTAVEEKFCIPGFLDCYSYFLSTLISPVEDF